MRSASQPAATAQVITTMKAVIPATLNGRAPRRQALRACAGRAALGYAGRPMIHPPFTLTVPVGPADHLLGSAHAPVQVVEYGDFACPHCRQAVSAVKLLLKHFEGKASFIFRHYPLEGVHPHAELAAEASESAGEQGKFWEMHDLLFENQAHLKSS